MSNLNKDNENKKVENLLATQIKYSCKLALPEGLNDLMSDISREVLRFQPRNMYQFIADYLSAMLVTRDNLSVAAAVCKDICDCRCQPELRQELEDLGLDEEDVQKASDIIVDYFEAKPINETVLLLKLLKDIAIDESMLPALQNAIRVAYMRHQAYHTTIYESSSDTDQDEMVCAAKHTMNLYRKTGPSEKTYEIMAQKIQASYRAYGVRRNCEPKDRVSKPKRTKLTDKNVTLVDPKLSDTESSGNGTSDKMVNEIETPKQSKNNMTELSSPVDTDLATSSSMQQKRMVTVSSTCLAGSFLNLPEHKPYSAHEDTLSDLEEIPEKEHAHIDYTAEKPHVSVVEEDQLLYISDDSGGKRHTRDEINMGLEMHDDDDSIDDDHPHAGTFYCTDAVGDDSSDNYDGDAEVE